MASRPQESSRMGPIRKDTNSKRKKRPQKKAGQMETFRGGTCVVVWSRLARDPATSIIVLQLSSIWRHVENLGLAFVNWDGRYSASGYEEVDEKTEPTRRTRRDHIHQGSCKCCNSSTSCPCNLDVMDVELPIHHQNLTERRTGRKKRERPHKKKTSNKRRTWTGPLRKEGGKVTRQERGVQLCVRACASARQTEQVHTSTSCKSFAELPRASGNPDNSSPPPSAPR
ncbi:uncharacterized protein BDZ83DRAFT_168443 [Colletotrichum acutatum]|uniref:Uncharacterized protein n=1 Tax=Glomerella acutata TaxID=27357 RepID=A0AAD8UR56_GLOAC|nr:uncharacterized protein BDZ83DRAFT_168443 [Colletotrichum acutatum]KAK1727938.1 hypothetical protein BDZ83DRAFT_168443 [Colletotrichum acutatum]